MRKTQVLAIVQTHGGAATWLHVRYLEPAHSHRRGVSAWTSPYLPTWPHVRRGATAFVLASAVASVTLMAPDSHDSRAYYAILPGSRVPWIERYNCEFSCEGEEGHISNIEPLFYAPELAQLAMEEKNSAAEEKEEEGGEGEGDSGSRAAGLPSKEARQRDRQSHIAARAM